MYAPEHGACTCPNPPLISLKKGRKFQSCHPDAEGKETSGSLGGVGLRYLIAVIDPGCDNSLQRKELRALMEMDFHMLQTALPYVMLEYVGRTQRAMEIPSQTSKHRIIAWRAELTGFPAPERSNVLI